MQTVNIFQVPFWEDNFEINEKINSKNLFKEEKLFPLFDFIIKMSLNATHQLEFIKCMPIILDAKLDKNIIINNKSIFIGIFYFEDSELILENPLPEWAVSNFVGYKNSKSSKKLTINCKKNHIFLWPSYLHYTNNSNSFLSFDIGIQ